tara:strand:- start:10309 stop:11544 length:1236 start_codon:yes stop_codon:yes gene_type:complete
MSKKINVGKITNKILSERYEVNKEVQKLTESIEYDPAHPERMHPDIEDKLRADSHHLGGNKSLPKTTDQRHYSEKLASKRYKDLVTSVKRYWGVETVDPRMAMQVMQLLQQVMELERPHRAELERLAVDLVREEFDVPEDQVDIDAKLVDGQISDDEMQQSEDEEEMDFESEVDIDRLNGEVQKRRMLNAIMQGAAKKGHYMFHMVAEQLTNIEPRLVGLYGKLMSMTDLTYWMIPEMSGGGGGGDMKGGKEKLDLSGDKPKIIAEAWILPVLLNELIKGVMELLAAHGLPEDEREANYVIGKADTLDSEMWDMRLGPVIWEKFIGAIEGSAYDIKHFLYYEMGQLPQDEFHTFMRELLAGSSKGKQMLVDMANKVQDDIKERASDDALGDGEDDDDDIDLDDIDISDLFK